MTLSTELSKPEYAGLSASECLVKLKTPSIEVRDEANYTWAGVALVVGPEAAEMLRIALMDNGMGWVVHQLGGLGIQLSNPLVQQALTGFAAAGLPGCAELKAKGISLVAPWQSLGIEEPTLEQVEEALGKIAAQQRIDFIRTRLDAAFNQIGTVEQQQAIITLRAIATELES